MNWNLLTKSISLASTLPPSPAASSLAFNMILVILMRTTLTRIVFVNNKDKMFTSRYVIDREQKQNKTSTFASFLYPPNI